MPIAHSELGILKDAHNENQIADPRLPKPSFAECAEWSEVRQQIDIVKEIYPIIKISLFGITVYFV